MIDEESHSTAGKTGKNKIIVKRMDCKRKEKMKNTLEKLMGHRQNDTTLYNHDVSIEK